MTTADGKVRFDKIGENDQIPYKKIDISKICRFTGNIAFSFYQIDYQAITLSLTGGSTLKPDETKLMPISKIVMDFQAFKQFKDEVNSLYENIEKEMKLEG